MLKRLTQWSLIATVLCVAASPARAQDASAPPPPPPPPSGNTNPAVNPAMFFGYQRAATFGFGWGKIGNSDYFQVRALLDLPLGPFGVGFQAPINLLSPFPSPNPTDKALDYGGVLRWEDWPVPHSVGDPRYMPTSQLVSHYLSLIRYIRYGEPNGPLYAQYGEFFDYTLGHGTIIEHYSNALDPNNLKPGLAFAINRDSFGLSVFTDDMAYPATNILAGRAYIRPLAFGANPGFFAKKWAIGFSYVDDRTAPRADGQHSATEIGIDTEYQVLNNSLIELTPYIDFNYQFMQANGGGLHIGALTRFNFPIVKALTLWAKLEYRVMQPTYIPNYFGPLYDVQRTAYPVGPRGTPVAQASAGMLQAPGGAAGLTNLKHGIYGEATVDVFHLVQGGAALSGTPGVANSFDLIAFVTLPAFSSFKVSAYYVRQNIGSFNQLWELDSSSYIAATALYNIWGPLWFGLTYARNWVPETDESGQIIGYQGVNSFTVGLQSYLPF